MAGITAVLLSLGSAASAKAVAALPLEVLRLGPAVSREVQLRFGLGGPVAASLAQIHVESRGRADAKSPAGAEGVAQIMPATAKWLRQIMPAIPEAGEPVAKNTRWAIPAMVYFDKLLWDQFAGATPRHRAAKMYAGYNGGPEWVRRGEKAAARLGMNPLVWLHSADEVPDGRGKRAKQENVEYPRRILETWEPLCIRAGFGPGVGS